MEGLARTEARRPAEQPIGAGRLTSITGCGQEGPAPDSPTSACGLTYLMISTRSFIWGVSSVRANMTLCSGSLSPRNAETRPLLSTR